MSDPTEPLEHDRAMPAGVDVETLKKIKLEDGDILWINIDPGMKIPPRALSSFRKHLKELVKRLGVKAEIVVIAGDATASVIKRNELTDICQRLDKLERRARVRDWRA